jgi:hypothetical protein
VWIGILKSDAGKLSWLAAGLIYSVLGTGSLGRSSQVYLSLEDYISRSKVILIGKAADKSTEPVLIDKTSFIKLSIEEARYYSITIEVSRVLKGEIVGDHIRFLYAVFKYCDPGKGDGMMMSEQPGPYTEPEEWESERIWSLNESKVKNGYYQAWHIASISLRPLLETTLGILRMRESEQVAALTKMLASENRSFVLTALDMLPRRKANAAVPTLIPMLYVDDGEIRNRAYQVLLLIDDDAGNLKLIEELDYRLRYRIRLNEAARIIENSRDL